MVFTNPVAVNLAPSSTLTLNGPITGAGSLTANGAGTLLMATNASVGVPLIANGIVNFASHGNAGGILVQSVASITVAPRGQVNVLDPGVGNHANRTLLVAGSLTFSSAVTGVLDLAGNDLDISHSTLAQVTTDIATGFNAAGGGLWNGNAGIISSTAASDSTHLRTLGIILNTVDGTNPIYGTRAGGLGKFDGTSPGANDVLVKFTYFGDANLDGVVDGSDYSRIDSGILAKATGWFNGDFNYDNVIDGSDYTLIDNAFNTQGASLSATINPTAQITAQIAQQIDTPVVSPLAPVPEPTAALALALLGGPALMRRRKRR